jgi:hypothetical protein
MEQQNTDKTLTRETCTEFIQTFGVRAVRLFCKCFVKPKLDEQQNENPNRYEQQTQKTGDPNDENII